MCLGAMSPNRKSAILYVLRRAFLTFWILALLFFPICLGSGLGQITPVPPAGYRKFSVVGPSSYVKVAVDHRADSVMRRWCVISVGAKTVWDTWKHLSAAELKQSGVAVKSIQRPTWRLHNHKQPFNPHKCQVRIGIPQVPDLFSFLQRVFEFPRSGEKSWFSSMKATEICGVSTAPEGRLASFPRHSSLSATPGRPGPRRRETLPLSNIQPAKWVWIIAHSTESHPAF